MRRFLLALLVPALAMAGPADLDPSFGTLGTVAGDYGDSPLNRYLPLLAVGATPTGYVALIQREVATPPDVRVFRVAFDAAGTQTGAIDLGIDSSIFGGGHVYADGRILFAYAIDNDNDEWELHVERRLPGGAADTAFGGGDGHIVVPGGTTLLRPRTVAVSASGEIAVAGYRAQADNALETRDTFVLRLHAGGAPDTVFSADGLAFVDMAPNQAEEPAAVAIMPGGQVLVCSDADFGGQRDVLLTRLRGTGVVDAFGSSGFLYYDTTLPAQPNQTDLCADIDVHPLTGAIVMTTLRYGSGTAGARVVAVDNAGNAGAAFDNVIATDIGGAALHFDAQARALLAVASKRAAGADLDIVRFTPGGAPDAGFGVGGSVRHALPLPPSAALATLTVADARLALDARGRILAGASLYENADDDAGWVMLRVLGEVLFGDGFE